ncbi:zinc ribbon domain-containing protein [Haloarchaeobius sp. HME9146]|uniref:zinc ribbon domain-containing protein n=1 Tax=Haloarchaeobius sp. HME9146 TaxID=2978732 RepID=UPI0021C1BD26|nr:zinc ribbon domain-containing protein [Haloarchaeobius sp. HME9146]MCT9097215.1 zinc ribbon domain-containing protein [Haloarchaeobius sp. HME9146]
MDSGSPRDDGTAAPPFCSRCGSRLGADARFCPQCGTRVPALDEHETGRATTSREADGTSRAHADQSRQDDTRGRDRRPRDRREQADSANQRRDPPDSRYRRGADRTLRERVDARLIEGWEIEEDLGDRVVLVDRSYGSAGMHVLVALTTIWWTSGLGNAAYAAYKYYADAERLVLTRRDGPEGTVVTESHEGSRSKGTAAVVAGLILGFLGLMLFLPLLFGLALVFEEVALVVLVGAMLIGGAVAASRAASSEHSFTDFGRTKDVTERVVYDPDLPCTACLSPIEAGVERRYSDQFLVLGVPVKTYETGTNHYCRSCADGETDTEIPQEETAADSADEDAATAPSDDGGFEFEHDF